MLPSLSGTISTLPVLGRPLVGPLGAVPLALAGLNSSELIRDIVLLHFSTGEAQRSYWITSVLSAPMPRCREDDRRLDLLADSGAASVSSMRFKSNRSRPPGPPSRIAPRSRACAYTQSLSTPRIRARSAASTYRQSRRACPEPTSSATRRAICSMSSSSSVTSCVHDVELGEALGIIGGLLFGGVLLSTPVPQTLPPSPFPGLAASSAPSDPIVNLPQLRRCLGISTSGVSLGGADRHPSVYRGCSTTPPL